jgi:predicted O-methyltransferase YrrM
VTPHEYDQRWMRACAILDQEAGLEREAGGASLSARALSCAIALVKAFDAKRLLELGSGSSTAAFAALCLTRDCSLDSVEHDERYLELTHALLRDTGVDGSVRVHHAAIRVVRAGGYLGLGYDLRHTLPYGPFDFALIDGPPALGVGRFMTLPSIWPYLADGALVLLDDAGRDALEGVWLAQWRALLKNNVRTQLHRGYAKGLALLLKVGPSRPLPFQLAVARQEAVAVMRWMLHRAVGRSEGA